MCERLDQVRCPKARWPGVKPATCRSQVQCSNHCSTDPVAGSNVDLLVFSEIASSMQFITSYSYHMVLPLGWRYCTTLLSIRLSVPLRALGKQQKSLKLSLTVSFWPERSKSDGLVEISNLSRFGADSDNKSAAEMLTVDSNGIIAGFYQRSSAARTLVGCSTVCKGEWLFLGAAVMRGYNYDSIRFDGRSTAYQRSLRSQRRKTGR